MARIDFTSQRLFVDAPLQAGAAVLLDRAQANYLMNVLRFTPGDAVLVFNGRDGEWRARLSTAGRKAASLVVEARTRVQTMAGQLTYAFAPLKQARLDYMVQKAVEMGAGSLQPVVTRHTQVARLNLDRVRANAVEAAEQCGVLALPAIEPVLRFDRWLAALPEAAVLIFCDEDADVADPLDALSCLKERPASPCLLVGPEGGFAADERDALLARSRVVRLSLGPRILRADTAAVAALALVQAVLGDWRASREDNAPPGLHGPTSV